MKVLIIMATLFFTTNVLAKKLILGTYIIPQYVRSEAQGEFIQLVKTIAARSNIEVEIRLFPASRALYHFNKGDIDGYFPSLDVLNKTPVAKTIPFYYKKDYIFSSSSKKISNLRSQRVCLTRGYPYDKSILNRKDLTHIFTNSDTTCLGMLNKGRADAFICEGLTGIAAMKKIKATNISIHQTPLSSLPVYIALKSSKKGKKLAKLFSKEIKVIQKNGELKALFTKAQERVKDYLKGSYDPMTK